MHELPVTQSVLDIVVRHAERAGAARVTDIRLVIGQLSSIVDDSVQFYWDMIAAGTIAEGARLHFQRVPAQMQCQACGASFALAASADFTCPQCGSRSVRVTGGEEFYVESIDVETA
ncbi:MAG: hydrogenase maturation nickel metallochaperone HypA [Aggregatilineales bacterium]